MILQLEIENAIAAAVAASLESADLGGRTPRFVKSWEPLADGEVKGRGDASFAVIAIAAGIPAFGSFCEPQADIECSVVLSVSRDADPTGAAVNVLADCIQSTVFRWNESVDEVCTDITTDHFSPGGLRLTGGSREQEEDAWTIPFNFTLRGVIKTTTTN